MSSFPIVDIIHGPNLNMLSERNSTIYSSTSLDEINRSLATLAKAYNIKLSCLQTNTEGNIIDHIHHIHKQKHNALIINPGAFTHTSVAIRDAIEILTIPVIEVHLSNIYAREEFRHRSLIAPVCTGQISGFGDKSYSAALTLIKDLL